MMLGASPARVREGQRNPNRKESDRMKKTWLAVAVAAACAVLAFGCGKGKAPEAEEAAAVQLTPEQEAKAAVDSFIGALQAGRMDEIYKLLPASYQADVSGIVQAYASKVDPALFDKVSGVLATFADVLEAQAGNVAALLAEEGGDLSIPGLTDGLGSNLADEVSADKIRASAQWLANAVKSVKYSDCAAGNIMPLLELAPLREVVDAAMKESGFSTLACAVAEADPDGEPVPEGVVRLAMSYQEPGTENTDTEVAEFVKVEGRWIPKDLCEAWGEGVKAAQAAAAEFSIDAETTEMLDKLLPIVQRSLASLKGASSPEELQAQATGAAMSVMMMMQMQ